MAIPEYEDFDGIGLAELVKKGEVTPLELVEEAISRIEKLNPQLNAVVYKMYDHARKLAQAPLTEGSFSGVPFLLKDMTAHYAGTPTTHGCKFLENVKPSGFDTEIVRRFKSAGLITVGKTNTPELAISVTTEPTFRGPSRNPWSLKHTTGGSSGGSAAAVAARIVPIGHGGDGAGSLRIPGSCCGIVGFKPSRMMTPHGPEVSSIWESCCGEFVLSRSVRDSAYMLDEVAGQDSGAYYCSPKWERPFREEIESDPESLKIGYSTIAWGGKVAHPDCIAAVENASKLCEELGHVVEEASFQIPDELGLEEAYAGMMAIETARDVEEFSELMSRKATVDEFEPANWKFIRYGKSLSGTDALRFKRILHKAARVIAPLFEDYDVYLTPTLRKPPVPIGEIDPRIPDWNKYAGIMGDFMGYTELFNIAGSAAVSLPLWWNAENLPIGCQFVTRMGADGLLLQLAAQLERVQPWIDRRPKFSDLIH
jgi:amidase